MKRLRHVLALLGIMALSSPAMAGDRVIVYPYQNPSSTQESLVQRYPRVAIGNLLRDMLGSSNAGGVYTNMTINPVTGLYVDVAPTNSNNDGTLYQMGQSDANPVPVNITPQLAADPTVIMLQGLLSTASSQIGPIAVPSTPGQSQYTLIEAQLQTVDTNPQQETFVNSAGGKFPQTVNTQRTDQIVFQAKAGTAGTSPTVPSVDSGWVSIGTILVPQGTSTITTGMITASTAFTGFTNLNSTVDSVTASAPLTSSGGINPNIALTSPLGAANGGTGATSLTANNVLLGNGTSAVQVVAPGTTGNVLTSNGTTWQSTTPVNNGVTSFSAGTTGLTPSTGTNGAVTLAGTLGTGNGGTGLTTFTSGKAVYASSSSALTTGTLPTAAGGTGLATFTSGGALYASSSSALTTGTLPVGSGGTGATTLTGYLSGNGTSAVTASTTIPTSALTGTLGTANGGTNLTTFTSGGAVYASSSSVLTTGTLPAASGGTGVTTSSGVNSVMLRDSNANTTVNNLSANTTTTTNTGGTFTVSVSSSRNQVLTGGTSANNEVYTLPNATTLSNGTIYYFNNASAGTLQINNNSGATLDTIPASGDAMALLTANGSAAGTWDVQGLVPTNASWGGSSLNLGTSSTLTASNGVFTSTLVPGVSGTPGTAGVYSGTGTPAFSAPAGSLFLSYSGTGGAQDYYNSSTAGTSGTSWSVVGSGAGGGAGGPVYPAPSSSPFPAGCSYNVPQPTLASGQTTTIQCDQQGRPLLNATLSLSGPLPIQAAAVAHVATSGSIATGGTAQTLFSTGSVLHGCFVQNTSSQYEYIRLDGNPATTASFLIYPGGYYECNITGLPSTSVSILGGSTGQTYYDEVW